MEDASLLETLLWRPEQGYWLLEGHLDRLRRSACYFFGRPPDERALRGGLDALAADLPGEDHRIRLLLDHQLEIELDAAPLDPADRPGTLVPIPASAAVRDNPYVAHKTTRREIYDAARREARQAGADDALLINERGELTESTIANLVVDVNGSLVTPPSSSGLLPGVYRRHLLDSGRVVEKALRLEDLQEASAIHLANSVRGLWQVELIRMS